MLEQAGIRIISTGKALPKGQVTNEDLSRIVDTNDEWIYQRTGMKVRHHVSEAETALSLAIQAASVAILHGNINPEDIGVVVVATLSADNFTPSTAALLQEKLGLSQDIIAIDLNAACSGFVFGLETLRSLLLTRGAKYGLLVGVEVLSKKLDMTDRGTCVLFGDGAGAALVEICDKAPYEIITGVEGDWNMIHCTAPDGKISMDGQATYKFAVAKVPGLIEDVVSKAGKKMDDIDLFLLHQANLRIIESVAKKLKQPMDKFVVNIEKYGNTSAASLGLALADAEEEGLLKRGDKIVLCAFGAGRTWGAIYMEW